MTFIIYFLLKKEIKDINDNSKLYFTRKAEEYTEHIKREDNVKIITSVKEENEKKENNESENLKTSVVYLDKQANYEINDLLKMMKQIDYKFNVDNEKIIKMFIRDVVKIDEEQIDKYNSLKEMKEYIDKKGVLQILTSNEEDLEESIVQDLTLINEDVFNEYYSIGGDFQVDDFCNYLDYEIGKCDPTIYVYVGDETKNYDKLNEHIKTIYSKDIYKGIKIIYLNQLYDFSLS